MVIHREKTQIQLKEPTKQWKFQLCSLNVPQQNTGVLSHNVQLNEAMEIILRKAHVAFSHLTWMKYGCTISIFYLLP